MLRDFPGKQENEKVLMVIRKHLIVHTRILFFFILSIIFPLLVFLLLWNNHYPILSQQNNSIGLFGYLLAIFYFLYGSALFIVLTINEEFDLFILTNHRLIDITQVSFLNRNVATTPLNQIQDTTSDIKGILGTLLNYGTVDVQTAAGLASSFKIDTIPNPALVARIILNKAEENKKESKKLYRTAIN